MSDDETTGDESPEVEIPEDEADLVRMLSDEADSELTEQERNVAIAQAKVIGDL